MKFLQFIVLAGMTLGLVSCASSKKSRQTVSLVGEWSIVSVAGNSLNPLNPYIAFVGDNQIFGYGGCNRLMGSYEADTAKARLQFGQVASTRMMCPHLEKEQAILDALTEVKTYQVKENGEECTLELLNAQGNTVMVIEKRDIPAGLEQINGEWNILTIENQEVKTEAGALLQLNFDAENKRVSGKIGDNLLTGALESAGEQDCSISFEQTAATMMAGPNLELEDKVKGALVRITSFEVLSEKQVALLDASGEEVILLERK